MSLRNEPHFFADYWKEVFDLKVRDIQKVQCMAKYYKECGTFIHMSEDNGFLNPFLIFHPKIRNHYMTPELNLFIKYSDSLFEEAMGLKVKRVMPNTQWRYVTTLNGSNPSCHKEKIKHWADPIPHLSPEGHDAFSSCVTSLLATQPTTLEGDVNSLLQHLGGA